MFAWGPTLTFVDETHVAFASNLDGPPDALIDVEKGEVRPLPDRIVAVAPGAVAVGASQLLLAPSFTLLTLAPTDEEWERATRVPARCAATL